MRCPKILAYEEKKNKREAENVSKEVKRERVYHKNKSLPRNYYNYFDICTMEGIETTRAKNAVAEKKVEGIKYFRRTKTH